ncbi:MAG: cation transporter [Chitinophagales bacterium]|nr:cation transporter [Chitinophagales bacterium]
MKQVSDLIKFSLVIVGFFVATAQTSLYAQTTPSKSATTAAQEKIKSVDIEVKGMTCQMGCANGIDRKLKKTEGVIESSTLLETGISKVKYDASKISVDQIIGIIKDRGYEAKVATSKS